MPSRARWAFLGGAIVPAVALVVWTIASATGAVDSSRLVSPWSVVREAVDLAGRGRLASQVALSLERLLTGFAFGSLVGLMLGGAVRLSRTARILLTPTFNALRAVPSLAWLPVVLVYLGIGEAPTVVAVAVGAMFPMFATVAGANTRAPAIVTGLRLALAQSWLVLIAAELLSASTGIGFLLLESSGHGRIARTLVVIAVLAALSKTGDALLASLERRVRDDAATLGPERTPDHL
ncbi:MAG: ABC transporter permease subunit [Pseudolysinimonas sp.]